MRFSDSALALIGNTPMMRLNKVTKDREANVLVKLEYLNPSGSIKDRIALSMIEKAENEGVLKQGSTIVESSSGNTAISLSFVGAVKGYRVVICLPKLLSGEKVKMIERYGAEVRLVDVERELKEKGIHGGYIEVPGRILCKNMEDKDPDKVWWARQFSNSANIEAHNKTGREILAQTEGKVDAFVASVGTGGTLMGVAEVLKGTLPHVKIVAVEPAETKVMTLSNYYEIPGATGGIYNVIRQREIVDEIVKVKDEDAVNMAHRLSKEEGLFCGISSGANVFAAVNMAKKMAKGANIVTVLPDSGDRYFTYEHYVT